MPLRFRSVVPYTLPGVLLLIGWWWYTSRKKDRLVSCAGPERSPAAASAKAPQAEGSNGLVEKDTPPHDTDSPVHRPAQVNSQRTEHEITSRVHILDREPALTPEDAAAPLGRPPHSVPPALDNEDISKGSLTDPEAAERGTPPAVAADEEAAAISEEAPAEEHVLPLRAGEAAILSSTAALLSDAQRPEPEGEVAKQHHAGVGGAPGHGVCALTPPRAPRAALSEAGSPGTPPPAEDLHKCILTSTPTDPTVQDPLSTPPTAGDARDEDDTNEDQDLELLAAGLITEVISAATQEVLGSAGHEAAEDCPPASVSSQEEPTAAKRQHRPSTGGAEAREAAEEEAQGVSNGCPPAAPAEAGAVQAIEAQGEPNGCPLATHLAAKPRGDEAAAALAEDSACSTCHSEDGVSSEDLQGGAAGSQSDPAQGADPSAKEAAQPQSLVEATSMDAVCEIKRLHDIGLRNGAHGPCEVDTDQSGGSDVNSMDSVDSGCTMSAIESQGNSAVSSNSELVIWEIEVPKHLVGRLIGKQGRYVSFLKQNSGAKIYISTLPYTQEFQICHIEGVQQQVDKALALIGKKFKDLDLTNLYAPPPPPLTLPSLPMTSWLLLPSGVTVEVIVVNIVSAGHIFVQQHTHPTYHALRSLDQQMFLCYSQPGTPALPSPAEVGVICAAPAVEGAWWRAQVITFYKETNEVEIRYVDYGGYDRVKIDSLRQIRSDFVTLPFQGAEVLLDNIAPLPGEDRFSADATTAFEEMTRGMALLAQVSNYDNNTGLPLVHLWNMVGDEVVSVNRALAERALAVWVDGF
ncbi:A kinase (PRKA) anchor protein 1b isoform 1-T3 [Menidia menidia]